MMQIINSEYVLKLLPKGTHDYAKFITPAELARMCRQSGLEPAGVTGMTYNPFSKVYRLGSDATVNYIIHARKPS